MRKYFVVIAIICYLQQTKSEEVRLLDLEPNDAQNIIDKQDQTLKYAPKVDSDVPAVRFLGQEPHNVLEDIYLAKQYHGQDGLGGYLYGYQVPDIAKNEQKKPSGDLKGAYNYINGAGQEIKVEYWDNGNGFHQVDNVPKILPKQIDDSPDVKAAKEAFLKRWNEEAERNTHPIQSPYNSAGKYASGPLSEQGQKERAQFFAQQQGGASGQKSYFVPQVKPQGAAAGQQSYYGQQVQPQGAASIQQSQYVQPLQPQAVSKPQPQYLPQAPQPQGAASTQQSLYVPQGAASSQQSQYVQYVQPQGVAGGSQQGSGDEGKYIPDEEEVTGPPKGFFYAFDYPVGIITQDKGRALPAEKGAELKNVYQQNKQRYERELEQGHGGGSSQYLIN